MTEDQPGKTEDKRPRRRVVRLLRLPRYWLHRGAARRVIRRPKDALAVVIPGFSIPREDDEDRSLPLN